MNTSSPHLDPSPVRAAVWVSPGLMVGLVVALAVGLVGCPGPVTPGAGTGDTTAAPADLAEAMSNEGASSSETTASAPNEGRGRPWFQLRPRLDPSEWPEIPQPDASTVAGLTPEQRELMDAVALRRAELAEREWTLEHLRERLRRDLSPPLSPAECRVTVRFDETRLGGHRVFFPLVEPAPSGDGVTPLHIPRPDGSVWVAFAKSPMEVDRYTNFGGGYTGINTLRVWSQLWRVDCERPWSRPTLVLEVPDSELGDAVLSPDGKTLAFRREGHLARLDLDTLSVGVFEPPFEGLAVPQAWTERGLEVMSVTPQTSCHDMSTGGPSFVLDPLFVGQGRYRQGWVSKLGLWALEATPATLWLSTGGLWRSRDRGRTWEDLTPSLPRREDDDGDSSEPVPLGAILADTRDPNRLFALSANRFRYEDWVAGGVLYATRDGGKTWEVIETPPLPPSVAEEGCHGPCVFDRMQSLDGSLDHVRLGFMPRPAADEAEPAGGDEEDPEGGDEGSAAWVGAFETRDGGQTWSPTEQVVQRATIPPVVPVGPGERLLVGAAAIWREAKGKREVVFPAPLIGDYLPIAAWKPITWAEWESARDANRRGVELMRKRDFDGAIAAFGEAYTANPNFAVARYNEACALARAKRVDDALSAIEALARNGRPAARRVLAAARADFDLASLRGMHRFRWWTIHGGFFRHDPFTGDDDPDALDLHESLVRAGVISDPGEALCLSFRFTEDDRDEPRLLLERFDCRTARQHPAIELGPDEPANLVNDLELTRWQRVDASSDDDDAVSPGGDVAGDGTDEAAADLERAHSVVRAKHPRLDLDEVEIEVYRSPSRRLVALVRAEDRTHLVAIPK